MSCMRGEPVVRTAEFLNGGAYIRVHHTSLKCRQFRSSHVARVFQKLIIIIMTSYVSISSNIELSVATKSREYAIS